MQNTTPEWFDHEELAGPFPAESGERVAADLGRQLELSIYARSLTLSASRLWFLARGDDGKKRVCCMAKAGSSPLLAASSKTVTFDRFSMELAMTPANAEAATVVREHLPFLNPRPLGLQKSAGCGDRLGMATPGHIRALRSVFGSDEAVTLAPIFAQQSIRENARTGRTPQEVMDDAMWGVFQEGWRQGYGADADHLKTFEDVDSCAAAGYTFYTIDPGEYVDDRANHASGAELQAMAEALPWDELQDSLPDLVRRLTDKPVELAELSVALQSQSVLRAAAKYGRAVAHTARMVERIRQAMGDRPYEVEMSVDETETVTTLAEHIYIASELQRLGVKCVSLAPRYVGEFEKGVDYIGDLDKFEESFAQHVAVAKRFGPYKLSLHSGSDKFRVYPIAAQLAGDLVHLKTAGTSYLEAVRAIAAIDPDLFREIVQFARQRYPTDRASYHVSADLAKMPDITGQPDEALGDLLNDFHGREVLHVTFGSVLNHEPFRERFFAALTSREETYHAVLDSHFQKHFAPFA
jgi:hypothetical protein